MTFRDKLRGLLRPLYVTLRNKILTAPTQKMNTHEFVSYCFQTVLGRAADPAGAKAYVDALNAKIMTREQLLLQFLASDEFKQRTRNLETFPPGHYYSAIPSIEDRNEYLTQSLRNENLAGIAIRRSEQFELLTGFREYYAECPFQEQKSSGLRYQFSNPSYSYTDAMTLYSMIRKFTPRKIIEVGSGYSSCVMLDTSERFLDNQIEFTFIEPYPELLYSLIKPEDKRYAILPSRLQDVDLDIFQQLNENDILFIDSTHVSKLGSDVNRIFFDILPALKKGVLVHFHDIFWPFDYPADWVRQGFAWNEAYMLRAFLEFNSSFEILFFASFLHHEFHSWFEENMPKYLKNTGGNIWIRKTRG